MLLIRGDVVRLLQTAIFEDGFDVGRCATEVVVHYIGIINATGCENALAELGSHFGVEDIARFLECFVSVGIKHF